MEKPKMPKRKKPNRPDDLFIPVDGRGNYFTLKVEAVDYGDASRMLQWAHDAHQWLSHLERKQTRRVVKTRG